MIYLASPYSHPDPAIRQARFEAACRYAAVLMLDGEIVYSPIAHSHPIACLCDLPKDWGYWERSCRAMIGACDILLVLRLDGWEASVGVNAEIDIAMSLGLTLDYAEA